MASPLIVDTSGIVALYDADSEQHQAFVAAAFAPGVSRLVSAAILSEIDYMLCVRVNPAAGSRFIDALVDGFFEVEGFEAADARYVRALSQRYPALKLGLADCAVMSLAERLHCPRILTTDRRHFATVKPQAFAHFEIVGAEQAPATPSKPRRR